MIATIFSVIKLSHRYPKIVNPDYDQFHRFALFWTSTIKNVVFFSNVKDTRNTKRSNTYLSLLYLWASFFFNDFEFYSFWTFFGIQTMNDNFSKLKLTEKNL